MVYTPAMKDLRKITFGRTGLQVSQVAYGGIPIQRLGRPEGVRLVREVLELGVNFIDTAHGYGHSEELIGEAIHGLPRDGLVLASKSPALDKKTFLEQLELSLKRLRTDCIDVYQHHNIGSDEKMGRIMGRDGAFEGMQAAVKAGKVRFPGFSSHSCRVAVEVMKTGLFDSVQIPFNFVDTEALDEALPVARAMNLGVIAMKPLGGGLLDDAGLCFRFLNQFEDIVPDPGIEHIDQMRQIIALAVEGRRLSEDDRLKIEALREELGADWCHRCDYCQPCPQGIGISAVLAARSATVRMPRDKAEAMLGPSMLKAADCTECGQCAERCPYRLDIPALLKNRRGSWERYLTGRAWS